jgi:prepilin peptidase CpaA
MMPETTIAALPAAILLVLGIVCAVTDLKSGRIYNAITYPAIGIGLCVQSALYGIDGSEAALLGFAVGFLPAFVLFATGGMGGGDVKLLGAVGALAGPMAATETLFASLLFGAFFGLAQLAWHGQLFRSLGRCLHWLARLILPGLKSPTQVDTPALKVRFGLAIACGIAVTLFDLRLGGLSKLFG